jgi:2',3'-cyclic-nucleotide 2'-phosphodiesterase/3'-nucleotidase
MKHKGADLVVVLAHCGKVTIDTEIAQLEGVDIVLGGHTHEVLPKPEDTLSEAPRSDVPVMLSGALGEYVGQMDLSLTRAQKTWQIASSTIKMLRNAPHAPESQPFVDALAHHHKATLVTVAKPIGETAHQIDSFFALATNNSALQLVAQSFCAALSDTHAKSEWSELPLLSAIAPFRSGGMNGPRHYCHIQRGPLRLRDLDKLYSFPDTLCALLLNGKALRTWLEMSASLFCQIPDRSTNKPLHNPQFPSYLFDVIPQLDYEIDLSQPPTFNERREKIGDGGGRISALCYQGSPVTDDARFVLATSSFRARGILPDMPPKDAPQLLFDTGQMCRTAISTYISERSPISVPARESWHFKPQAETSATFLTSQCATGDPAHGISFLRNTEDGFSEMRLSLEGPIEPHDSV